MVQSPIFFYSPAQIIAQTVCETSKSPDFLRKDKTVISVENPEFSLILDDKTDFTVGIVSQNLSTTLNFVKFRDSRNFKFFEATGIVWDTLHILSGSRGATCHVQS